ncbi:MAG: M1 family metallopeptidase [Lysobacterales bacterium]
MRVVRQALCVCVVLIVACSKPAEVAPAPARADKPVATAAIMTPDPQSYANYDDVRITDAALDLDVSFERKQLAGTAQLAIEWLDNAANTLVLDTRDLDIGRIERQTAAGWEAAKFELAPRDAKFGSKLTIALPDRATRVRIAYTTRPEATGLQWLEPAQTLGKTQPFMFSQSQAIHARSWIPIQDTPAVRFTYSAHVTAPAGIRVVMSADNKAEATGEGGYTFSMPQPIPSYLLAIAAGELEFRPLGARSGVYAEKGRIEAAANEFTDTEAMIDAAEKLYGEYRWGRYDLLVLPPSFPFGGMENPRLTFATPTVIAGDKSLTSLIAHELAHSWSGNLVTNAGWRDFWLNEGFTSYVENRIVEVIYGAEFARMEQVLGQDGLIEELKTIAKPDQRLVVDVAGRDPDETFSGVPYQKGAWLLLTLEQRFGRALFDPFLRGWFDQNAFKSVTTEDFIAYLKSELMTKNPGKFEESELDGWLNQPGIPANAIKSTSSKLVAVDTARTEFLAGTRPASALGGKAWSTQEWLHFLKGLPPTTTVAQLEALDAAFNLTATGNAEIAFAWFKRGIAVNYMPIKAPLEAHLIGIGRRKLVVPLYDELAKTPAGKAEAIRIFNLASPGYHPLTRTTVATKLGVGT